MTEEAQPMKRKNKSSAYEFYNSLGCPKYVVAPMVSQSELAFRMLCRRYGADLCYTPMIHSRMCMDTEGFIDKTFGTCEGDRPLIAQFCANKPELFLGAARQVEGRCDGVDLNLGCPQGIAKRGHYGAFLLEDTRLIREMILTAHLHLNTPVTAKIRILPKEKDTLALARLIQDSGAQILTVHGRTRDNMQHEIGACNFDIIRKVKQELKIPVFSNGGIELFEDVEKCLKQTEADGVMVSEAILENPMIFSGKTPDGVQIAKEYLEHARLYPCPLIGHAMRPHMFKFLYRDLMKFTDLRDAFHSFTNEQLQEGPKLVMERRRKAAAQIANIEQQQQQQKNKKKEEEEGEVVKNGYEEKEKEEERKEKQQQQEEEELVIISEERKTSWYRRHRTRREEALRRREMKQAKLRAERAAEKEEGRGKTIRFSIFGDDDDDSDEGNDEVDTTSEDDE
uniref:tRNA-dihydrouridine(16/17) synthase [NAD(P)(+)] n=1 Tax=Bigelowiella natans TaxID=227086 RepID=A0A6T7E1J6_BIGNA|mmetsp:Transcript_1336/g.2009  ORF Transcript_1336/g.2009 Transcript_1336/m.2009 type:complete len:452 (+) Transcript_1336:188-1543(+)